MKQETTFSLLIGRKTPTQGSKTPSGSNGGDRFIPNRGATNFELGNYLVSSFFHSTFFDLES